MFVYTRAGTWNGFELNPAAWTLVGSATAVAHAIAPALDPLPIPVSVTIPAGATQGFYITGDSATTVAYTSGVAQLGAVIGSDAFLQVTAGPGVAYPFATAYGLPTDGRLWNGRVHYCPAGSGTVLASNTTTGLGCVRSFTSFYENFTSPGFDLNNTSFTLTPSGSGYVGTTGGTFRPVGSVSTPVVIAVGDDVEETVTLVAMGAFPSPTGPAATLTVCSNGFVSTAAGNGILWTPDVPGFLAAPQTAWRCWHDFANNSGGQVKFEENASVSMVTWDNVRNFGGAGPADDSTWQIQFYPSGNVVFAFATMSALGNGYLVGYSPGGTSANPGGTDISATLAASTIVTQGVDVLPLAVAATNRPILNTNWNLTTSQIPVTGVLGADILGIADPGILDLGFLGLPGCQLRASLDQILGPWLVAGTTHNYSFFVPNSPAILNVHVYTQSIVFQLPPVNAFGAIVSNGVDGRIGDY
jgi:hypothetical protein